MQEAVVLPTTLKPRHVINTEQVTKCAEFIGLSFPVAVKWGRRNMAALGSYEGLGAANPYDHRRTRIHNPLSKWHWVTLNPSHLRDTAHASAVLGHELVHAWQCEDEYGGDHWKFFTAYNDELRALGAYSRRTNRSEALIARYNEQRHEAEANRWMHDLAAQFPMVTRRAADPISVGGSFSISFDMTVRDPLLYNAIKSA